MITNSTVCKIKQSILFFYYDNLLTYFFTIVFVFPVDTVSITDIISSHFIIEVSTILFEYLPLSQTQSIRCKQQQILF